MSAISSVIANIIRIIAEMGAGVASAGFGYEPKMPEVLKK